VKSTPNLSAIQSALVTVAFLSLLVMLLHNRLDQLVHNVLYTFGLRFSYTWAMPYWVNSAVVIGLSWFNIIAAFALVWYLHKRAKQPRLVTQGPSGEAREHRNQTRLDAYGRTREDRPRDVSQQPTFPDDSQGAAIQAQVWANGPLLKVWDVRRPKDVVDSQC
jgi:hypothetical protein